MVRTLVPLLAVGFALSACDLDPCGSTPAAFERKSEQFFAQVEEADMPADDDDWRYYDERLRELVETCYPQHEGTLSGPQERLFWQRVSGYYVKRYGRAAARDMLRGAGEGVRKGLDSAERWLERTLRD